MNNSSNPIMKTDDEIDLAQIFGIFWGRKYVIIFVTIIALVVGVLYALLQIPIYRADALVQLEEKSGGGLALSDELSGLFSETPQSVTEVEIIRSRMILVDVVKNLNLDRIATPKRLPLIGNFLSRYNLPDPEWELLSSYAWHNEAISLSLMEVPEYLLGEPVTLIAQGNDQFSVDLNGQILEGKVGELLLDSTTNFKLRVDQLEGVVGREYILTKIIPAIAADELRGNLSISERGKNSSILQLVLNGPRRDEVTEILNQITQVYQSQNLLRSAAEAENSLAFIREQLPQAQEQVQAAEDALNAFKSSQDSVDLSFETLSLLEQAVAIEGQLSALILKEQELQKRFTQSHPSYQTLLDNRRELTSQLAEIRGKTVNLPETQQEMLHLSQDLEVAQQVYLQLLNRSQELNVIKAGTLGSIRIIDTALTRLDPIEPNRKMIVVLAGILGLILSMAYVLISSYLKRGVQSVEEIEEMGIPVYATISRVGNGEYNDGGSRKERISILAKDSPTNLAVEALRSLRTSLHFGMLDAKSSLIMITSSRPHDGKSFVSINLATVVAQSGQNVCLVDLDLRRGYLRRFLSVKKNAPGITDVLAGDALIEDVIHRDEDTGLYFISTGKYPPNPSELLMSQQFSELMEYLDKRFDLTILDTPPILAVTDPIIVGKYTGMVLLVARHGQTNTGEIGASKKILETNDIKITGAVLNGYDAKVAQKSGQIAYQYQYSYKTRDS